MNISYIKNNWSLLDLIKVDLKTYIDLHKELKQHPKFNIIKEKFEKDNTDFNIDDLERENLFYLTNNYKDLLAGTNIEKKLRNSEIFKKMPNLFRYYLSNCSTALLFILKKENKLFQILENITDYNLLRTVINKLSDNMKIEYIDYLIEKESNLIIPNGYKEERNSYDFLSMFNILPETIEPYIKNNESLLRKIKKEQTSEELIRNLLKNPNSLKEVLLKNLLTEDEKIYLYKQIKPEHLRVSLLDCLPKEVKESLYSKMTLEQFDILFYNNKTEAVKFFLENIENNLYLIKDMDINILNRYYRRIRNSILSGTRIGKQGLKYFLIKNKKRLDKELLEYVLKKYPRFHNSLSIKIEIDFDTTPFKKELTLRDCVYKEELTERELNCVNENIDSLMKMNFQKSFSNKIKEIILNKLTEK